MRKLGSYSAFGIAALLVALLAKPALGQSSPGPIDGLWSSVNTPDALSLCAGARGFEELVLIESSLATREIFSGYGFLPTPSTVLSTSPLIKYETIYTDATFGTLKVNGIVASSLTSVTGTMQWTRKDGTIWNYTFSMNKIGPGPTPPMGS
jgi:hypothetical protein